jgi:predicted nucleic acid-binding Zn ribbon protein
MMKWCLIARSGCRILRPSRRALDQGGDGDHVGAARAAAPKENFNTELDNFCSMIMSYQGRRWRLVMVRIMLAILLSVCVLSVVVPVTQTIAAPLRYAP